jgi:amino acid transporter
LKAVTLIFFFLLLAGVTSYYYYEIDRSIPLPPCQIYQNTGIHCPGCGTQRAIKSLLNLEFQKAFSQNLLFVSALLSLVFYFLLSLIGKKYKSYISDFIFHQKTIIFLGILVLLFIIFRNLPIEPFCWLAPDNFRSY